MRDAFPIVANLGQRLEQEPTGWRDAKALIVLVAQAGPWDAAAALADALGINPAAQEAVYREIHPAGERPGRTHQLRERTA